MELLFLFGLAVFCPGLILSALTAITRKLDDSNKKYEDFLKNDSK